MIQKAKSVTTKEKRRPRLVSKCTTAHGAATARNVLPYTSFEVLKFRCFEKFKIDSLGRVNLLTGLNNSGKTSLLEALFLHLGRTNPSLVLILNSWRGLDIISESAESQWGSVFWQLKDSQDITLKGVDSAGYQRTLKISISRSGSVVRTETPDIDRVESIGAAQQAILFKYTDETGKEQTVTGTPVFIKAQNKVVAFELRLVPHLPPIPTSIFVACRHGSNAREEIERFSVLRKKGKDSTLLSALKIVEPRLEKLEILMYQGVSMIHGYLRGYEQPLPSPLLGDGVRRSLSVLLAIGAAENGVVLVDEIENGIHHSSMKPLWSVIAEASRTFNCQVFATTHSEECIYAAHRAFKEGVSYDLMLYRLDRKNGSVVAVKYDEATLNAALSIPLEVRGWPSIE
ncbi:MAG: ATP/GTP phosphatase [Syntrophorhabdus sp. PtaU1.Bin002]|nr:MAG: ATP/GTP phosphatase [Syntrophorhabdus sp. PtaB.Bin006]OPY67017.1 MAG: ATP/GTP phosphatase [Syntrophorhabdus sp. PtaU1.Bin002]